MSDKIANFEDYVKRDASNEHKEAEEQVKPSATSSDVTEKETFASSKEPVSQETMEIEIEDPYQFLNADEREEYIRQRQKDQEEQQRKESVRRAAEDSAPKKPEPRREEVSPRSEREPVREKGRRRQYEEPDEEYDEEYDDEEYQDEDDQGGVDMNLVVRVGSILTGIVILVVIGMVLKVKVFDRYFAPDPDEATSQVVAIAIPAGYTEKNDTVVVSGASSLNLRSVPSTGSDDSIVAKADEGTELKRIAVSDDGSWALVDYQGQQLYGFMKYLKEK